VHDLQVGQLRYRLSGSDSAIALAHALGCTFIELQQLEFTIIAFLQSLANDELSMDASFALFASKTFGNLIREMQKHSFLDDLTNDMRSTKERRDFFVHKFLFNRFGGESLTTESEYESLIREAHDLGNLFAESRTKFINVMLNGAPLVMFGAKQDSTGELVIVESEFAKARRGADSSAGQ